MDHQVKVKGAVLHLKARTKHRGSTANKQLQRDCSSSTCMFMLAAAVLFCLLRNCACNGMLRQEQSTEAAAQQQQTQRDPERDCSNTTSRFIIFAGRRRAASAQQNPRAAAGLFKSVGPRAIDYEGKTPVRWSTDATWFEQCCCDTRRAKTEDCRGDLRYFIQDQSQAAGC